MAERIISKPLSRQGRENYDRVFGKIRDITAQEMKEMFEEGHVTGYIGGKELSKEERTVRL